MSLSDLSVGVFAKYPLPGQVKTRLIPELGELQATQLAHFLIARSLAQLADVKGKLRSVVLWTSGGDSDQWQRLLHSMSLPLPLSSITLLPQSEGDLGRRMQWAVHQQLKTSRYAMLLGADAVGFGAGHVINLLEACQLSPDEVAFCPADDGGYVAVCLGQELPDIFLSDIAWGSGLVAQQTRSVLASLNKRAEWLPSAQDLDEPSDFQHAIASGNIPKNWQHLYGSGNWLT